jgi:hypothetical protein
VQILTESDRQERNIFSQTGVEIKILRSKRDEAITDELEGNLKKQFQLQSKKREDAENDNYKSQYNNSDLNSATKS